MAAAHVVAWGEDERPPSTDPGPQDVDAEAARFRGDMAAICDAAMPRARGPPQKGSVYWWSPELAVLRERCNRARRRYTHYRRRRRQEVTRAAALWEDHRDVKKPLQRAIKVAKDRAWSELLGTLDDDPWGRPYKIVRNKLRTAAPPVTEGLDPQVLEDVMSALFPAGEGTVRSLGRPPVQEPVPWTEELGVTEEELARSVKKLRGKNTAPGPDGVPAKALALATDVLAGRLIQLFNSCLQSGRFPSIWKEGRVVLIPKSGRPAESPSAYRPIVLLDEAGKLFERVLAARVKEHLSRNGPDLADCQFGFREGRSTVDAVLHVKALSDSAVARGGVALAVSLDIANAFNTLPWACIREALRFHGVPSYVQEVIGDYLRDRGVMYTGRYGAQLRRDTSRGVPQGSVLGPLLWNLGYNWVLRAALLPGMAVVCYADDTLVMSWGDDWDEATRRGIMAVAIVVGRIRALGLQVALHKTEALYIKGPRRRGPPVPHLEVLGVRIEVKSQMKYLGLTLDCHWRFEAHFDRLAPRLRAATGDLARIMPNFGGPGDRARRLYLGAVQSIALYGAPVWSQQLGAGRKSLRILREAQRRLALRAIRGYRTVSYEAACVVAGQLPWDLAAEMFAAVYHGRMALRRAAPGGVPPPPRAVEALRRQSRQLAMGKWSDRLHEARSGLRVVEAVRPVLVDWVERRQGGLTFRLVQVLTGHGCFGQYLHRIGREPAAVCHHCGAGEDTAQHTLEECPAWVEERRVLLNTFGDLSLSTIVSTMVDRFEAWGVMASFCETVISRKEAAERVRENDPDSLPQRRRRGGVRRRAYARVP